MTITSEMTKSLFKEHELNLLRKIKLVPIHCLRELLIRRFNVRFSCAYLSQRLNGIKEISDQLSDHITSILNDIANVS